MKRILITGVGGNVGQYLAQKLHMDGYRVVGTYRNRKPDCAGYELVGLNLTEQIPEIDDIDTIIHAAACLYGNAEQLVLDNINATRNLINYAERHHVKKFIYLSTVSVYGDVDAELNTDSEIINPSVYGCTKYIAEKLLEESNIPIKLVIGLPRMLGPFVNLENTQGSGFLTMTKKLLREEDVTCYIPNLPYNNYMHVQDLAVFLEKYIYIYIYMEGKQASGYRKILLGAKDRLSMMEILEIMKTASRSRSNIIPEDRGIKPHCSLVSIDAAVKMGYEPRTSEEMLVQFINDIV
jgi:nucleoside-diphosphate-sugar epimerase